MQGSGFVGLHSQLFYNRYPRSETVLSFSYITPAPWSSSLWSVAVTDHQANETVVYGLRMVNYLWETEWINCRQDNELACGTHSVRHIFLVFIEACRNLLLQEVWAQPRAGRDHGMTADRGIIACPWAAYREPHPTWPTSSSLHWHIMFNSISVDYLCYICTLMGCVYQHVATFESYCGNMKRIHTRNKTLTSS